MGYIQLDTMHNVIQRQHQRQTHKNIELHYIHVSSRSAQERDTSIYENYKLMNYELSLEYQTDMSMSNYSGWKYLSGIGLAGLGGE